MKKVIKIPARIFKQVDAGVKFLDNLLGRKEWLSRMNMKDFDIMNVNTCVAGNVFSNGMAGYDAFTEAMQLLHVDDLSGIKFGFYADDMDEYPFLQDVWVKEIKRLKKLARVK